MKRFVQITLALVFLVMAAVPANAAEEKTFHQRAGEIQRTYGIAVSYDAAGEEQAVKQIEQIETALSCLGPVFTRKMADHYASKTFDGELKIRITADENWEAFNVGGTFSIMDNTIRLYVRPDLVIPAANIVHEFGHVYHWSLSEREFDEFCEINGEYAALPNDPFNQDYFDADRYVNKFAESRAAEDFAETFMMMIANGGGRPATVGEDTVLYRKYLWIRNSLADHIGTDSEVARRASGFLQIQFPD